MHEPCPDRVPHHVNYRAINRFLFSQNPIKGFFLPHFSLMSNLLVDSMGRRTLNHLHNFWDANWSMSIGEGRQKDMHVVWHDYGGIETEQFPIAGSTRV
jgi:hypothetical protein